MTEQPSFEHPVPESGAASGTRLSRSDALELGLRLHESATQFLKSGHEQRALWTSGDAVLALRDYAELYGGEVAEVLGETRHLHQMLSVAAERRRTAERAG